MNRRRRIYEGKAKVLYEGPEPGTLIQHFKDDATAFNNKKHALIEGKGVLNNRISEYIFTKLGEIGVPTHFVRRLNMREQLIREVEIIPLEVVVRNVAAGSLVAAAGHGGRQAAAALDHRVLLQERRARRPDGVRGAHHRVRLGRSARDRRDHGAGAPDQRLPGRPVLRHRHPPRRLQGRVRPAVGERADAHRLADEISPDCCRLWDAATSDKLDKDRFRRDLGGVLEAYQEVARRLGVLTESPRPKGSGPVLVSSKPH